MLPLTSARYGLLPLLLFCLYPSPTIADINTWVDAAGVHHCNPSRRPLPGRGG
jgi:hypothetical protein